MSLCPASGAGGLLQRSPAKRGTWSKARASAALCRLGAPPPPSASRPAQVSANSGNRWRRTGSASAQPAQYAAGAVCAVDSSPSPPSAAGSAATARAWAASCGGTPPRSVANVFQTASSCMRARRVAERCAEHGWREAQRKVREAAMRVAAPGGGVVKAKHPVPVS